jgi:hypothetical protein
MAELNARANDESRQVNVAGSNFGPIYFSRQRQVKPNQLPADLRDFSGRSAEIERLALAMAARGRGPAVVNLFGKPGVGKSALAVRVCHNLQDTFEDGSLYADMSDYDPHTSNLSGQVLENFVQALDSKKRSIPLAFNALGAYYRSLLHDKRCIILLDNAQRAEDILPLLAGSDATAILITSRRPLAAIPGVRLEGLSLIDVDTATLLLAEISGRTWDSPDQMILAEVVVNMCGLLPLAIRIAGALMKGRAHWTLQRLVDELANEQTRLERLREADLDVRSSFLISYRGLSTTEAEGFRYLGSLETAEFDAGALAALLDSPPLAAERILDSLADAQLIEAGPSGYRFHDLLRLFARDCLVSEEDPLDVALSAMRMQTYGTNAFVEGYTRAFGPREAVFIASWDIQLRMPLSQMVRRTLRKVGSHDLSGHSLTMTELMDREKPVLLLGGPGSGKSIFATQLRHEFAVRAGGDPARSVVCVVVTLRQLSSTQIPINDYLLESVRTQSMLEVTTATISDLLNQGRMFVAFDGLDELTRSDQEQTLGAIEGWLEAYPLARCVVTSRPVGLASGLTTSTFDVYEMADLSTSDFSTFGARVLATHFGLEKDLDAEATELAVHFQKSGVGNSPLLFSLALEIFMRQHYIATETVEIYEKYVGLLTDRWDRQRGLGAELGAEYDLRDILRNLALAVFNSEHRGSLTQEQVLTIVTQTLGGRGFEIPDAERTAEHILGDLRSRGSVFVETSHESPNSPTYGFTQRAILEYLVADAVSRQASSVQLLADQLTAMVERGGSLNVLRFSLQLFERRYEHYRVLGEELMTRLTSANILATSERLEAVSIVEGFLRETDPPAIYADSSEESL